MGRKCRLFASLTLSPGSQLVELKVEIAESLRPCPRIFPFCGDYRRRQFSSRLPPEGDSRFGVPRVIFPLQPKRQQAAWSKRTRVGASYPTKFCSRSTAAVFARFPAVPNL
jgi:hypothetical protein